ncbi:hypothetical protein E8E13_002556 [Curvularia kusanoi]|uniref:Opioid growth factor receptor (OGFr) conserved domain-containing protein n=1 Tax=Curvularia kusanoi TaxID=90978 RepID=A0A9P4W5T2_CURKU|nr:hypothetical protein E8E13_002556 [Curvularia kusanoi]
MSASKRMKLSNAASLEESTSSTIVRFYDPAVKAKDALSRTHAQILGWSDDQLEHSHNYIQMLFPLPEGSPFNWSAPIVDLETFKAFRARSELRQGLRESFERMLSFYGFAVSLPEPETRSVEGNKELEHAAPQSASTSTTATEEQSKEDPRDAQNLASTADIASEETPQNTLETTTADAPAEEAAPVNARYSIVRGPNWRKASMNWCGFSDHNHLRITRIIRCLRVLGLQHESQAFFAALKRVAEDPKIRISNRSVQYWTRAAELPLYIPPGAGEDECEWLKEWEDEQQPSED